MSKALVLTTPSKIANVFDWKKQMGGSLATIDVHADQIGVTIISSHKSSSSNNTESSVSVSAATIQQTRHRLDLVNFYRRLRPKTQLFRNGASL